jgi:hypothetical protein
MKKIIFLFMFLFSFLNASISYCEIKEVDRRFFSGTKIYICCINDWKYVKLVEYKKGYLAPLYDKNQKLIPCKCEE